MGKEGVKNRKRTYIDVRETTTRMRVEKCMFI